LGVTGSRFLLDFVGGPLRATAGFVLVVIAFAFAFKVFGDFFVGDALLSGSVADPIKNDLRILHASSE
jgi:hypothetical protein